MIHFRNLSIVLSLLLAGLPAHAASADADSTGSRLSRLLHKGVDWLGSEPEAARTDKGSAFNFIGGPYYHSQSGLSAAVVGTGYFSLPGCDSLSRPSYTSLKLSVSTKGFWLIDLEGTLYTPGERWRLNYEVDFENQPIDFWGVGWDNAETDSLETRQRLRLFTAKAEMLYRIAPGLHLGPAVSYKWSSSNHIARPELLQGKSRIQRNLAVGAVIELDTRDLPTGPTRGVYVHASQMFSPRFLWNGDDNFSTTRLEANAYTPLWRGATLAGQFKGELNYGHTSWASVAQVGNSHTLRGYYPGRYRDNNLLAAQIELRQRIYRRHGMAAWVGCGALSHHGLSLRHLLPDYGLGYRLALRRGVNVRFDMGWGRHGQSNFMFGINEAF